MMAAQFMLERRLEHEEERPLLSCADIKALLVSVLPRRDVTLEEVVRQMEVWHAQRQGAIQAAYSAGQSRKVLSENNLEDTGPT